MKRIRLLIIIQYFSIVIISCKSSEPKSESRPDTSLIDSSTIITDTSQFDKPDINTNQWIYESRENAMTSDSIYFAQTVSDDVLNFDFPYDGGATAYLTIRNKEGINKAYIEVSKGQFLINTSAAKMWKVRFDKANYDYFLFNQTSSGNTRVAFISRPNEFIKSIKKHKQVIIEAEFYQEGTRVIKFNINNLMWNH